jgi:transmembrane 9 superfamily member 2/4
MIQKIFTSLSLLVAWASVSTASFYLPGVSPDSYENSEAVKLFVTKLTSTKTQIPYDYYSLNFCKPKHAKEQSENLGEVLSGDRIENSVYKVLSPRLRPRLCFHSNSSSIDLYERTKIL